MCVSVSLTEQQCVLCLCTAGSTDRPRTSAHLEGAEGAAAEVQPGDQRWAEAVLCHKQCEFTPQNFCGLTTPDNCPVNTDAV